MLILSASLGVWALSSALAIGGVLGSLFFAAAFLGLAFDVVDLFRLTSGELTPEDYLVEMAVGLLLEAALGGLGDVARRLGVGQLADEVVQRVIRQLDEVTDGAIGRLIRSCGVVAAWLDSVPQNDCFDVEALLRSKNLGQAKREAIRANVDQILDKFPNEGANYIKALLRNKLAKPNDFKRAIELIHTAPKADELDRAIRDAVDRENYGFIYQLQRAVDLEKLENYRIAEYEIQTRVLVAEEAIDFASDGRPITRQLDEPKACSAWTKH